MKRMVCFGGDPAGFCSAILCRKAVEVVTRGITVNAVCPGIRACHQPVIAAVDGVCAGAGAILGFAKRAFEEAVAYVKQRAMFGKNARGLSADAGSAAHMATAIDVAALLTYRAAWQRDTGQPVTPSAAMAKMTATEKRTVRDRSRRSDVWRSRRRERSSGRATLSRDSRPCESTRAKTQAKVEIEATAVIPR